MMMVLSIMSLQRIALLIIIIIIIIIASVVPTVSGGATTTASSTGSSWWQRTSLISPPIVGGIQSVLCGKNIGFVSARNNDDNHRLSSTSHHHVGVMEEEEDEDSFACFLAETKRVGQSKTRHRREMTTTTTAATFAVRRSAVPFQRHWRQYWYDPQHQPTNVKKNDDIWSGRDAVESRTVVLATRTKQETNKKPASTKNNALAKKKKNINNTNLVPPPPPHHDHHHQHRPLTFLETMVCGAVSRSIAQTTMHPANTMKTLLQKGGLTLRQVLAQSATSPRLLFRGAGANFLLSIPHGAINFAMLEGIRSRLSGYTGYKGPGVDFASSCLATIACSIVSTPQMMICDNIMAGNYPNLFQAVSGLAKQQSPGVAGFYTGWWPGLVGKIPSYALTWTFFQQLKRLRNQYVPARPATDLENSAMGCLASALSVCLMIPIDTIKTRLVTQTAVTGGYNGIIDCAVKTFQNEGILAFYRGLPPRLVSVVPMIGIQFGVYEFMKKVMLKRQVQAVQEKQEQRRYQQQELMEEDLVVEGSDVP